MRGEMTQKTEKMSWSLDDLNEKTHSELEENADLQREPDSSVSRWSKYMEQNNEELSKEEQEEGKILQTERQQFYLNLNNTVKEQRKHKKPFCGYDGKDCFDETDCCALTCKTKKAKQYKSCKDQTTVVKHCNKQAVCEDFRDSSDSNVLLPAWTLYSGMSLSDQTNSTASKWGKCVYRFKDGGNDGTYTNFKAQGNWVGSEFHTATMLHVLPYPGVQQQKEHSVVSFRNEEHGEHLECQGETSLEHLLKPYSAAVPPSTKTSSSHNSIPGPMLWGTSFKENKDKCVWKDPMRLNHEKPKQSSTKPQPPCVCSTPLPCSSVTCFSTHAIDQAPASTVLNLFQTGDDFDDDL